MDSTIPWESIWISISRILLELWVNKRTISGKKIQIRNKTSITVEMMPSIYCKEWTSLTLMLLQNKNKSLKLKMLKRKKKMFLSKSRKMVKKLLNNKHSKRQSNNNKLKLIKNFMNNQKNNMKCLPKRMSLCQPNQNKNPFNQLQLRPRHNSDMYEVYL